MGRTFRASTRMPSKREPLQEEKEKARKSERERPERPGKQKKTLQDVCMDLKKEAVAKLQEQVRQVKQVEYDADYEKLLAEMYGPQIDPRDPLLKYEGERLPRPVFEDLLVRTYKRYANRLPLAWESEKDYLTHCLKQRWVELDDTAVTVFSRAEDETEAA